VSFSLTVSLERFFGKFQGKLGGANPLSFSPLTGGEGDDVLVSDSPSLSREGERGWVREKQGRVWRENCCNFRMRIRTKRGILPYDIRLTKMARENRNNPTEAEEILWQAIRKRKINGYKFLRQKPVHHFILDLYCAQLMLGIEVDGSSHREKTEYDRQRDMILEYHGIRVLRFTNQEIEKDFARVLRIIRTIE
jgi:very-short-patch-repair endonuclease